VAGGPRLRKARYSDRMTVVWLRGIARQRPGGEERARTQTDVNDAQWLQRLHRYGLLRASFRPRQDVATLRWSQ
jgi:hypothetical protein